MAKTRLIPLLLAFALLPLHAQAQWKLAWEDNFDRADVGPDWLAVSGKASIRDGRLLLEGGGATLLTARTFAPDVRLEFDAEAMPGLPPCDLSATIGANKDHGYGYLLAFGGQNNRVNQLLGSGVHQVDRKPKLLIEHGKKYHIIAQEEGKRLTCSVNGITILDAVSTDLAAGPGFDRVGLVTWNGMYVDNLKVYERAEPHPDTPAYPGRLPDAPIYRDGRKLVAREGAGSGAASAVKAFNRGDLGEALRRFRAVADSRASLVGQAYVIGDLAYQEKQQYEHGKYTADFEDLASRLAEACRRHPTDSVLAAYLRAAESFKHLIMMRSGMTDAIRLVALGPENNPFYYKARLYEARYHYWNGAEGGSAAIKREACDWMAELKELWPENTVLKQYTGESVPWGERLCADTERHPAWAAYLREAYARNVAIMERFFRERQGSDGGLGGGYGDDCELMRTWMQVAAISTASEPVRLGIERLADGIWRNECKDGFAKNIGDVEHSSEPSADMFPTMLLVRYGDPLWIERNLRSCKTIHDVCMGIDKKGYPRFKSSEFGASGVNLGVRAGGDTGYHARPMKHFIWQAWWGDPHAKDWFVRWCDGWRAATMAEVDGKISGYVPPTIWYPSGDIDPPNGAKWFDKGYNYYGNMGGMIEDAFLCAYYLSKDPKFLKPFQKGMDLATSGPLPSEGQPENSPEAQRMSLIHMPDANKTALYKWLTGERVYDEYTLRFGDPAQNYRVNYDLDTYQASFARAATSQRNNLELQTTEVLSTDRAALGSALTVFGAYTGAVCGLRDAATPTFAVTYDTPDNDFAALVTESTPKRLRVWLYSFHDKPMRMGLKLWQLTPGSYVLNQGELVSGEHSFQHRYRWVSPSQVKVTHRADVVYVSVPAGKVWVVDLRLDTPIPVPKSAPDLAVGPSDVRRVGNTLSVTVHNVGNAASAVSTVLAQVERDGRWITVGKAGVPALAAPKDFLPSRRSVTIPAKNLAGGRSRILIDPSDKQYEICETNNSCIKSL